MTQTRISSGWSRWLVSGWLLLSLLGGPSLMAAARSANNGPTSASMQRPPLEETLDWVCFGLGSTSMLLVGLGLMIGLAALNFVGIIIGFLSLTFSWWRWRFRERTNWQVFIGRLGGSLAMLAFLTALVLVAFL